MARAKRTAPHGIWQRYAQGCRCEGCRAAWAAYIMARRRARGVKPQRRRGHRPEAVYPDKASPLTVWPTALGRQILEAAVARTGQDADDVVEQLLRTHGPRVMFDDTGTPSTS